jgi:hypothetical protein
VKGSTGVFAVGVLVGVVGALLAVKLRKGDLALDFEGIGDRIQDNLAELESRIRDLSATTESAS